MGWALVVAAGCTSSGDDAADSPSTPDREQEALQEREFDVAVRACAETKGLVITEDAEGNWGVELQPENPDAFTESIDVIAMCREEVGVVQYAPLTDAELNSIYDGTVEQAQCLRDLGYDVEDVPSRDSYTAQYRLSLEGGDLPWFPIDEVPDAELESALNMCPEPRLVP